MLRQQSEFFPAVSGPVSRAVFTAITFLLALALLLLLPPAAAAWAGGIIYPAGANMPNRGAAACTIGHNFAVSYAPPAYSYRSRGPQGGHRDHCDTPYRSVDNQPTVSYDSTYTDSLGETTSLSYNTGYYDKSLLETERLRLERQREEDKAEQQRDKEYWRRIYEEDREEARGYHPKPPEDYEVSVHGYGQQTLDSVVDASLTRNQNQARATKTTPPSLPASVQGMTPVGVGDEQYYYLNGTFYALDGDDNAVEVDAPAGAMVFSLPKGFETVKAGGIVYYVYNGTYYTRLQAMGRLIYKVAPNPAG